MFTVDALLHSDRAIAHFRLSMQARFDLAQLNAITANLHLVIDPANVLQHTVTATPRQVTGAIQTLARRTERVWYKHRRRTQRIADITAPDAGPGNTQLTHCAQRHQFQGAIDQVQQVVVGRRADRQVTAARRGHVDAEERHVVRALRRAVRIDQTNVRITQQPLVRQLRRHCFTGRQHPAQAVEAHALLGEHALDQRRHAFQHGDALGRNMRQQTLRIVGDGVRHDVHPCAEQRRGEELPHGNVEALRGGLGDHVGVAQVQIRHFAQLVVEHAALLDHHAFGQTGGTGGVDHIGQVVRTAVDAGIVRRQRKGLDLLPDQQPWPAGAAELVKQGLRLFTARLRAHQQWRSAQFDDPAQTLARQARVQRQVTRAGLEAADDHAQQIETAFGQQCHRLIAPDAGGDQRMTETVTALVQFQITVLPIKTTGGNPLRVSGDLRFKQ
ncbi:hypothetical protein D3C72_491730 [compost metagenome]